MTNPAGQLRLLVVGLNYAPEEVGIARYTTGMARGLLDRGWQVKVVCGHPYYPQWRVYSGFGGSWRRSLEHGVEVVRCPHFVPRRPTGMKRLVHLASFALAAIPVAVRAALSREQRPDLVLCVAPALAAVPTAWLTSKLSGCPLWIHVQDFEVDAAFATNLIRRGGAGRIFGVLARHLEAGLLRAADRVSTISPHMVEALVAKGVRRTSIFELRNWADGSVCPDPARGSAYRDAWGIGRRKVALYSGSISNKQGIDILVEAAHCLRHRDDLVIVICGEGAGRQALEEAAADCTNLLIHDLQPTERMGELLGIADVHLLPQLAEASDLVLPSKLANMLASGRPIAATALPGTGIHDELQGCGICTPPGDAGALAQAIEELVQQPQHAAELGERGHSRALERWSQAAILDDLAAGLAQLLAGRLLR